MNAPLRSPIVECRSLSKSFGASQAVREVTFHLHHQEFLAILGPSGCGKSTILRLIAGFETPDRGQVWLDGQSISEPGRCLPPEARQLGMVFQDFALFPHLSVAENIAFGLRGSSIEKKQRVEEMLELVGLQAMGRKMPHMISGGEQQRVAVARALAMKPRLVLLDEPFSNLDYQLRVQLREEIRQILRKGQVSVILVTHDQTEAFSFADRMLVLHNGEVVQTGTPREVYHAPCTAWAASFLGEANFLPASIHKGRLHCALGDFPLPEFSTQVHQVMIRPEDVIVSPASAEDFQAIVVEVLFLGGYQALMLELEHGLRIKAHAASRTDWKVGDHARVTLDWTQAPARFYQKD